MFFIVLRGTSYVVAAILSGWLGYMVGGVKGAVTCVIVGLVIRFFFDVGIQMLVEFIRKKERKSPTEFRDSLTFENQERFLRSLRLPLPEIPFVRTTFAFFEFFIWGFWFILFCRFAQLGNPDRFLACVAPIQSLMSTIHNSFPFFAEYLANNPRSGDALHVAVAEVVVGGLVVGFAAMIGISVSYFVAGWNEYVRRFELAKEAFAIKKEDYEGGIVAMIFPIFFALLLLVDATIPWGGERFVIFNPKEILELELNILSNTNIRNVYGIFFETSLGLVIGVPFFLTQMYFVLMRLTKFPDSAPIPTKDTGV